jgi:Na+/H+ antiporter NhaD/arsenite permease-like protein
LKRRQFIEINEILFHIARAHPAAVQEFLASGKAEMAAISMGAVLLGAATYIGNSPNFMIKAIAEQHKMQTPSFVGFVTKFSLPILLPVLFLVCWLALRG